jgi:hypothetical protein
MNLITKFFWQKYLSRSWADRGVPIIEIDDVIALNFNSMFDRNYAFMGTDQLIYQVDKIGIGKRFLFVFEDGCNPILSGGIEIVKLIIKKYNLTPDTCLIFCRDDLDIPLATIIKHDSIQMWINVLYPTIKDITISTGRFTKKFAAWFHRGTFYRLQIARQLYTQYKEDSYISYQEYGMLIDLPFLKYFEDDRAWADANTPIIYDQLFPKRVYDHDMIVGAGRKPYHDYFMEIVVETDCVSNTWITEKAIKNLYIGRPFIMMSGAHSLTRLQQAGFKTFSPWFDESYDQIENNYQRFEAIKQEIDRIATFSLDELNSIFQEMLPTIEYNRHHYLKLVSSHNK